MNAEPISPSKKLKPHVHSSKTSCKHKTAAIRLAHTTPQKGAIVDNVLWTVGSDTGSWYANSNWSFGLHVGIGETDFNKFWPTTQTDVDESVRVLQRQRTQARLDEAEKLLGWNWTSLEVSSLNRNSLRGWFDVEHIHFDAMHAYWSNGIIAQELGLWYDKVTSLAAVTLDHLQAYADIGWQGVAGTTSQWRPAKQYFTDKLFRKNTDYRGDADCVLAVLPLCVAFGEEILRGRESTLDEALDSLIALQKVSVCILDSKISATCVRPLHVLQQEHMRCFLIAYGAAVARPKLHFATHLKEQCEQWNRMIDCFVCERKHRAYKALCGNQVLGMNKSQFTKTALLQLAQQELNTPEEVERFHTRQLGVPKESKVFQNTFRTSLPAWLATGLEHQAVRYVRGQFLLLGKTCAVEIQASVKHQESHYLLVETLEPQETLLPTTRAISKWKACHSTSLLEVTKDFNALCVRPSWIRRDSVDTITLLRWNTLKKTRPGVGAEKKDKKTLKRWHVKKMVFKTHDELIRLISKL